MVQGFTRSGTEHPCIVAIAIGIGTRIVRGLPCETKAGRRVRLRARQDDFFGARHRFNAKNGT
jgi:hypothetical protein